MNDFIIKKYIRILKSINDKINILKHQYGYKNTNDLIMELLEIGIINFEENKNLEHQENILIEKIDMLNNRLDKLESNFNDNT